MDLNKNIITETQQQIVQLLKSDESLTDIPIYAENIRDIDFLIKQALGKQGLISVIMTPKLNFVGDFSKNGENSTLAYELDDLSIVTTEYLQINRASNRENFASAYDVTLRIADILGSKYKGQFSVKNIEASESDNLLAVTLNLKCLVVQDNEQPVPEPVISSLIVNENGVYEQDNVLFNSISVDVPQGYISGDFNGDIDGFNNNIVLTNEERYNATTIDSKADFLVVNVKNKPESITLQGDAPPYSISYAFGDEQFSIDMDNVFLKTEKSTDIRGPNVNLINGKEKQQYSGPFYDANGNLLAEDGILYK